MEVSRQTRELERSRHSESLLRLLIDSLPAFISYVDSEQRYVLANVLYREFFGVDKIIGRKISEVLGDEAYQRVRTYIEAALLGTRQSCEYALSHAGKTRDLKAIYVPHIERGKVVGIFILGIDITEQKRLELRLAKEATETKSE